VPKSRYLGDSVIAIGGRALKKIAGLGIGKSDQRPF
jgi:hypothetical protein